MPMQYYACALLAFCTIFQLVGGFTLQPSEMPGLPLPKPSPGKAQHVTHTCINIIKGRVPAGVGSVMLTAGKAVNVPFWSRGSLACLEASAPFQAAT